MKLLRALLIIIVIIVVIIGILTMVAPTKASLKKSTVINAPREVVFKEISTFSNLHKWYPWDRKDPNMKYSIEGTDGTVGAMWKWKGNDTVGQGEQTFTKIDPNNEVDIHLHFIKPWNSQADANLYLADTTDGTKVTWEFMGNSPRPMNIMLLFMNMDAMVGNDFEQGLLNLKELSEKDAAGATASSSAYQIEEMDMPAKVFVGKKATVAFQDMGKFFKDNLSKIGTDVQKAKLEVTGPPSGIFYTYDTVAMNTEMAAVYPVKEVKSPPAGWQVIEVPAGKAFVVDYFGDSKKAPEVYKELGMRADQKSMKMKLALEEYVNDPMTEKDTAKWETKIYYYVE
ncbi:MAG TPA: GyrI-like domain-containing protein [Chitinophagales bacterium]|nr:GyrI-like domain-containing protein [Chitinophagales bacterium]